MTGHRRQHELQRYVGRLACGCTCAVMALKGYRETERALRRPSSPSALQARGFANNEPDISW